MMFPTSYAVIGYVTPEPLPTEAMGVVGNLLESSGPEGSPSPDGGPPMQPIPGTTKPLKPDSIEPG